MFLLLLGRSYRGESTTHAQSGTRVEAGTRRRECLASQTRRMLMTPFRCWVEMGQL